MANTTVKNCNITVQPENFEALGQRMTGVVALAQALKANAEALGKAADALVGPNSQIIGINIEGDK